MINVEDFKSALTSISITAGQKKMLKAHLNTPGCVMTSSELAKAANYANYRAANLQYGNLAKKISKYLGQGPMFYNGEYIWTFALADGYRIEKDEWKWTLRKELVHALEEVVL
jgi:predicted HNH restriction endonuclease